ncbi:hypothetical protein FQA39_LY17222 [Lamprigera yunnana]|nr:hypothetical protein FQA39_LY17222 [Lamprigera yunnana]
MSLTLNPEMILRCLNELGYKGISATELKEFMKDLKRLIKYETQNKARNPEIFRQAYSSKQYQNVYESEEDRDKNEEEYNKVKERRVRLKMKKPHCCDCNCGCETVGQIINDVSYPSTPSLCPSTSSTIVPSVKSSSAEVPKNEDKMVQVCPSTKSLETNTKGTKLTFCKEKNYIIVPRTVKKFQKCDPVELYHKYKKCWKNLNIPGETDHTNLRWAIRHRLLGQSKSTSAPSLSRGQSVSTIV